MKYISSFIQVSLNACILRHVSQEKKTLIHKPFLYLQRKGSSWQNKNSKTGDATQPRHMDLHHFSDMLKNRATETQPR